MTSRLECTLVGWALNPSPVPGRATEYYVDTLAPAKLNAWLSLADGNKDERRQVNDFRVTVGGSGVPAVRSRFPVGL